MTHRTNQELLRQVARREITPSDATEAMLRADFERSEEGDGPWVRLAWAFMIASFLVLGALLAAPADADGQAPRYTQADGLAAARGCVSESTWRGGSETQDCGGIIQVVESRRAPGEAFTAAIRRTMPRFFGGRTDRLWALHLPYGPITENPEGWPYAYGAAHHSAQWRTVMDRVRGYMLEGVALPCSPQPSSWLGRETDGHVLREHLDSGLWRESDCGGPTVNAFLYRVDVD